MKPSNRKFAKAQKGRLNYAIRYDRLHFGNFGIVANEPSIITASHLSAIVLAIKRHIKKEGKVILRIFPHLPVTKKPSEVRMGKGKGSVDHYITKIQRGTVIAEILSNNSLSAISALKVACSKLPLSSKILKRI